MFPNEELLALSYMKSKFVFIILLKNYLSHEILHDIYYAVDLNKT